MVGWFVFLPVKLHYSKTIVKFPIKAEASVMLHPKFLFERILPFHPIMTVMMVITDTRKQLIF